MANSESSPSNRSLWYFVSAGLVACLALLLPLDLRLLPRGVPGQWEWPWREGGFLCRPQIVLVPVAFALLTLGLSRLLAQAQPRRRWIAGAVLLCCLVSAVGLVVFASEETVAPLHFAAVSSSHLAIGYFSYATAVPSFRDLMGAYSNRHLPAPAWPGRVGTHPPGPVVACVLGLQLLRAAPGPVNALRAFFADRYGVSPELLWEYCRWYIMPSVTPTDLYAGILVLGLITALGCLMPVPAYFLGRELAGPREGLIAAFLVTLVPSLHVFYPSIEGVGAVLGLTALAVGVHALRHGRAWGYAATGLAFALALQWTIGLAGVAVALVVIALCRGKQEGESGGLTPLRGALLAAGAFGAFYVFLYFATGYSLLGNLRVITFSQHSEMQGGHRHYLTWLPMNLYDYLLFLGPVLAATGLHALFTAGRATWLVRGYAWGAAIAFGAIWLSGSTLGEVGRIWLFLMVLWAVVPAPALAQLPDQQRRGMLLLLMLSQIALSLALHCNLALVRP